MVPRRGADQRHIIPELGRARLVKLQPADVRKFPNDKRAQGLSPRTVQYLRTNLRTAIQQASADGLVGRNVVDLVAGPTVSRFPVSPLTPEQVGVFLASVAGDPLEALYFAAFTTGLRQGELLGIRWQDLDLDGATLCVAQALQRGKGVTFAAQKSDKSARTVALPAMTVEVLRRHRRSQVANQLKAASGWNAHSLVFVTDSGTPLDHRNVSRRFQLALSRAGLPKQRFHDARHSCATFLLSKGVAMKVIQEILGHSSIQLTSDTYAHVIPQLQREAMNTHDVAFGIAGAAS